MKIRKLLVGLSLSTGLLARLYFLHAQDSTTFTQTGASSLSDTNVNWNTLSDLEVELKAIEATPTISAADLASQGLWGTFYSVQHLNDWPPLPGDIPNLPVWEVDTNLFLINDTNFDYTAAAQAKSAMMVEGVQAMDVGVGGGFSPDFSFPTNGLWLQINGMSNGLAYLTLHGTTNAVEYEILSQNTLSNAPRSSWNSEGTFFGSATTNWTATTVAQNGRTNLFMAARSWVDSTGSGIPDWWWLLYFGQSTNVNPYGNPAGDGWNNLEKFQFGMNPTSFYTPAAPQNLTMQVNNNTLNVYLSWQANKGSVSQYEIDKNGSAIGYVPSSQTYYNTTLNRAYYGTDFTPPYYGVKAIYSNSVSSPAANVNLLLSQGANPVQIIQNSPGQDQLVVGNLPPDATLIHLFWVTNFDLFAGIEQSVTYDVSVSNLINGVYTLPVGLVETNWNNEYYQGYPFVQILHQSGQYDWEGFATPEQSSSSTWLNGLARYLKNNLNFLLRSATINHSFSYTSTYPPSPYTPLSRVETGPTYEYSGYRYYDTIFSTLDTDISRPVEENYLWRNFAYVAGDLNTGASYSSGRVAGNVPGTSQPEYEIPTNQLPLTSIPSPALADDTASFYFYGTLVYAPYTEIGLATNSGGNYYLPTGEQNVYGLPILAVKSSTGAEADAGGSAVSLGGLGIPLYVETTFPSLTTVDYYFADMLPVPGTPGFTPGNAPSPVIAAVGQNLGLMAWARQSIGTSGKYAYLEQYFDHAYQINSSGAVTTNATGFLSSYGSFTPTNFGPVAIVTVPDIDTGQRGTSVVYCISLALDANHDGVMDTSSSGPDFTTQNKPYVFWANNNYDRNVLDKDDNAYYDDDVAASDPTATSPYTGKPTPDYEYRDSFGNRIIPTQRDLEDFARLWVCGVTSNLLAALPPNSSVTLNWGDVGNPNSANPTIDIFQAVEPAGGIGYLTNETIATEQIDPHQAAYVNRLGPGDSIQLNVSQLGQSGNWLGNHYIWCGVSNGMGQLNLTIMDASNNVLAQASEWIQIEDIKDMYERWTVGDSPNATPTNTAQIAATDLPDYLQLPFRYSTNADANMPYILLVHGWNDETWVKDRFAECAFKRLYWQGYHGRFGEFRWPTDYDFNATLIDAILQPHNYDGSEFTAWQSAVGLLNKLVDLNAEYPGHVYVLAHSMGNVVTGEALRLAAQNGDGQLVNTYVGSQAAIPAHVYDAAVTSPYLIDYTYVAHGDPAPGHPETPNIYGNRLTNTVAAIGRRISFYNVNDYALNADAWCFDQEHKPDTFLGGYYFYNGSLNDPAPWNNFQFVFTGIDPPPPTNLDIVNNLENRYEVLAYAANPYSTALGATPISTFRSVDMTDPNNHVWPATDPLNNSYKSHFWHSAQFRGDAWLEWNYWQALLRSSTLGFNISN